MIDIIKETKANHHPNSIAQSTFPEVKYISGDGIECKAEFALRVTDRDFLYKAGFHNRKPNGCCKLIAWHTKTYTLYIIHMD